MYVRKVKGTLSFILIKHYDIKPCEEGRSPSFLNSGKAWIWEDGLKDPTR